MNYIPQHELHLYFDPAAVLHDLPKKELLDSESTQVDRQLARPMKVLTTVTARALMNISTPTPNRVEEIDSMKLAESMGASFYTNNLGDHVRGPLDLVTMPYSVSYSSAVYASTPVVYRTEGDQGWRFGRVHSIVRNQNGHRHEVVVAPEFLNRFETDFTIDTRYSPVSQLELASEVYASDMPDQYLPNLKDSDQSAVAKMDFLREYYKYRYSMFVVFSAGAQRGWLRDLKSLRENDDVKLGVPTYRVSGTASILIQTGTLEHVSTSTIPEHSPVKNLASGGAVKQGTYALVDKQVEFRTNEETPNPSGEVLSLVRSEYGSGVALASYADHGSSILGLTPTYF